jgi:hypothetical protein
MADTVATVNTDARAFLNDQSSSWITDAQLLPYINMAYRKAQTKLALNGLSYTKEVFAAHTVNAGVTAIGSTEITNLYYPTFVEEKAVGEADEFYVAMDEKDWEPTIEAGERLRYWAWREGEIKFPASTQNRVLRVKYIKSLAVLTGNTSPIVINGSVPFLAAYASAIAAGSVGANQILAGALMSIANIEETDMIAINVRNNQGKPVKQKAFRRRRR